jgi:D-alanyl-D-alanine dipeptidase
MIEPMGEIILMADPVIAAIPVTESHEKLVDTRTVPELRVDTLMRDDEGDYAHLRIGVVDRLVHAQTLLPGGFRLLLVEGFRPPPVQLSIFESYADTLRAAHPDWTPQHVRTMASRYVSPPEIAPHSAGAAIDLTLADADGIALDMGTVINATPEESDGGCYTDADIISASAKEHRRVLGTALDAAGLVNYPTEWWHWSYGDRYWARATGAPSALYGPATR